MSDVINLDALTETQRKELYAQLAYTYGRPGAKQTELSADEQAVWDAICRRLVSRRPLADVLAKAGKEYTRASYEQDVEWVTGWIDRGCGRPVTRTQRLALIDTAIECLIRWLDRAGVPVTHKTAVQNLSKVPAVVDRAYPGYQDARILDRLAVIAAAA